MAGICRCAEDEVNICDLRQRLTLYTLDLTRASEVCDVVADARPDLIFHLAAQAAVPLSWEDPESTIINNIVGQLNVLKAVLTCGIGARILVVGSNEEYGRPLPEELPIKETNPLRPCNPYAVSKVAQDMMGYQYFASHSVQCVRVRPFNHIGPRQSDAFVTAAFARQVAEAEAGLRPSVLKCGNLTAQRDFTDVRDMVRGYYLALTKGEPGEVYNLGSGRSVPIQAVLDFFLSRSKVAIRVEQDSSCFRPIDVAESVCDFSKIRERTGWEPRIPLEQSLADVLEYWREKIRT